MGSTLTTSRHALARPPRSDIRFRSRLLALPTEFRSSPAATGSGTASAVTLERRSQRTLVVRATPLFAATLCFAVHVWLGSLRQVLALRHTS